MAPALLLSLVAVISACSNDIQELTAEKNDGAELNAASAVNKDDSSTAIQAVDRLVFSELRAPLTSYIQNLEATSDEDAKNTMLALKNIVSEKAGAQAFKAHYGVTFFDQYSLQGLAVKSSTYYCDKVVSTTNLNLSSDDNVLNMKSVLEETQALDYSKASYISNYFYQVSTDKVDVNQRVEGNFKRQFNGLLHHQELPYSVDALHDAEALFIKQSLDYKLAQLQDLKLENDGSISFSFMSAPEDVDSTEVLNVVEGHYQGLQLDVNTRLDTYLLEQKHFLRDEQGGWVDDGHSIEWLSASGIMLYESFIMPSGLSMQYSLNAVSLLEKPLCE